MFIKLVDAHPLAIAGGRSVFALGVMFLFVRRPRFTFSLAQVGAGAANAATMLLFVAANKLTTSANAILLQYAAPVYVAVLAVVVLKEPVRRRDAIALGIVLAGTVLFFAEEISPGAMVGNVLAALSGLTFALTLMFLRMQKDGSPAESLMIAHLITMIVSLPFWGGFRPTLGNLGGIAILGVFQIGLAGVLLAYGIRHVSALAAVLIVTLEPVLNPVWVFLATGEQPSLMSAVGGTVIIAAVIGLQLADARSRRPRPAVRRPRRRIVPRRV